MKYSSKPMLAVGLVFLCYCSLRAQDQDYPIQPKPFSEVQIQDNFWAPRIKTNHEVTIPIAIAQSEETGRIDNFKIAAGRQEGSFCSIYPFDDSDIFKIIEAASYSLQTFPDPKLEAQVDSLIDYMAAAQEEDGYLYTNRTIGGKLHPWAGNERWELVHELSHELYNVGHMYEAAAAHYQATGKRNLLDIAIKNADLLVEEFGPEGIRNYPGHEEVEIGLVRLYRVTKDERYLKLAQFFLDIRGQEGVGNPKKYDQSHKPVIEQREAVGHAVRGAYLWTGMADIAAITGNKDYMKAIDAIWHDIVDTKYYINGGIGATGSGEAFGDAYELPNMSAYCETCAGVGNAKWNHRMFLMTGDSKFIDVLERTMYNNIMDGVSLSGDRFFYPNPLASYGQHERQAWFGCACCPPNVARFLPEMPGYIYAQREGSIYVNLYVSSATSFNLPEGELRLQQESEFPWEGNVHIRVKNDNPMSAEIRLRVPGYVQNQPVPSDLYEYTSAENGPFTVQVNGAKMHYTIDKQGYIAINRSWTDGDTIEIDFPMEVQVVKAHPKVEADAGRIAFERGPILYCAEWADNPDEKVLSLIVDPKQDFNLEKTDKLGGIYQIKGKARQASRMLDGSITVSGEQDLQLIPYHLWNNRGPGEMTVWMATNQEVVTPEPAPTIARRAKVSSSKEAKSIIALNDQMLPEHSNDHSIAYHHWWPNKDQEEWVAFDFDRKEAVSKVKIYWFDDGPNGGCRIPASWKVQYKKGKKWKPVKNQSPYTATKDAWDEVNFKPVKTEALRVLVQLPKEYAAGLYEVVIE
ncbi:MAG TPA: glycoside hydrolase family 127 protein [Saprospiraceae bacterium]|nr:glycoside hydrolase family 127 protein [Saprospiraceae bacterium]